MTLGFRNLRGADTGIDTGFKKGTFVPGGICAASRACDHARRGSPRTRTGPSFRLQRLTRLWRSGRRASADSPRLPDPVTRRCELCPASFRSVPVGGGCGARHVEGKT